MSPPRASALPLLAGISCFLAAIQVLGAGTGAAGVRLSQPLAIVVLALSAVGAWWFGGRFRDPMGVPAPDAREARDRFGDRLPVVLAVAALAWAGWTWIQLGLIAWHRPVLTWDSLVYHVPAMHDWVVHGRVGFVHGVPDVPFVNYPMGMELSGFVAHQAFRTSRFVNAYNLWYWPLAVTALAVIAGRLGARGVWPWLAGALLAGVPTFVGQSATAYVDAGFAAAVMASMAAACVFASPDARRRRWVAALLGINLGLMLGCKGFGLPFVAVFVAALAGVLLWTHGLEKWHREIGRLAAAGLIVLAVGGYWYLRNAVVTGNPIYPIHLQIGHQVLAPGWNPAGFDTELIPPFLAPYPQWLRPLAAWLQPDAPVHGPISVGGLGWVWILGAVPAVFYAWWLALSRRRSGLAPMLALCTAIVVIGIVALPSAWESRYTLFLHALGLPCLAAVLGDAAGRWRARRGHLVTLVAGFAVVAVAVWEGNRTLALEWHTHRHPGGGRAAFLAPGDLHFPGLAENPGFRRLLADERIARGRWASEMGTMLGGVLALPLGARDIRVLPPAGSYGDPYREAVVRRPPRPEDIDAARASGIEWFLWESETPDDLPESLTAVAAERHTYCEGSSVYFHAVRLAPWPDAGD